jgi:aspartate/methionine/tyrosine aminotransferase
MNAPWSAPRAGAVRPEAEMAPTSGIVDVMSYGRGREGLIPLWAGEGDRPTPAFIADAAARSLREGETFYTWQRGLPELREALARYHARLYARDVAADRFFVTTGGMHAAQIAIRIVAGPGDEVLVPTPCWPNFDGAITVAGARTVEVPMSVAADGWTLDLDRLASAITGRTRALVINSPANPTGWTATPDDLRGILALARRHGIWIIADEIYARFVYGPERRSPSFKDVMAGDDRVLFVGTFSKNWAMTGWRIGWLEAPPELGQVIENLVQYSTSGVPAFLQRGAIAALDEGDAFIGDQVELAARGREAACGGLRATGLVDLPWPRGAFYAFFSVHGAEDTRRLAFRLIDETQVGLAPGTAFGAGGATHLRLCFLRRTDEVAEAVRRMAGALPRLAAERATPSG